MNHLSILSRHFILSIAMVLLTTVVNDALTQPAIGINDFSVLKGRWKGQLTYLDYSSNKQQHIKTNLEVGIQSEDVFSFNFYYTDEPDHNNADTFRINTNGSRLNEMKVIERTNMPGNILKIVLEEEGKDGNDSKPATFHFVMMIAANSFSFAKLVRYQGTADFFQRNEYSFSR